MRVLNAHDRCELMGLENLTDPDRIFVNLSVNGGEDGGEETVVDVQGDVGDPSTAMDAPTFVSALREIDTPIRMRINTYGGAVYDATDIYHAVVDHPYKVTADIVGACWSSGTIICSAADTIRMGVSSVFGIHRAQMGFLAFMVGNHATLGEAHDDINDIVPPLRQYLREVDEGIAKVLSDSSGNTMAKVRKWMEGKGAQDGTQFVGQAAVDAGFADEMLPTKKGGKPKNKAVEVDTAEKHTERMAQHRARQLQLIRKRAPAYG